jgi:hypothetical protein
MTTTPNGGAARKPRRMRWNPSRSVQQEPPNEFIRRDRHHLTIGVVAMFSGEVDVTVGEPVSDAAQKVMDVAGSAPGVQHLNRAEIWLASTEMVEIRPPLRCGAVV